MVVGVDSRWVEHSLAVQYPELLKRFRRSGRNGDGDGDVDEMPARPSDYLEKIFQIPYRVRRLDAEGCRRLIDALVVGDRESARDAGREGGEARGERASIGGDDQRIRNSMTDSRIAPEQVESVSTTINSGSKTGGDPTGVSIPETKVVSADGPKLTIESLRLTEDEIEAMKGFAPLIGRSPRATKRFVNIYRLIKAAVPVAEQGEFLGGGFRLPMLLLAVSTQAPSLARELAAESSRSRYSGADLWEALLKRNPRLGDDVASRIREQLPQEHEAWKKVSSEDLVRWQNRVAQFSFEETLHPSAAIMSQAPVGALNRGSRSAPRAEG